MDKWLKIGIGVALVWLGVLRGAHGLIARVHSYSFRGVNLTNGTVTLDLNILIKNPLFVGMTIKRVTGDVYAQGVKVGSVDTTLDYYISGGRTHILPVVVNLQTSSLSQAAILNIQSGDVSTLTISFNGNIYVGNYGVAVPLQLDLDYNDLVK